MSKLLFEELLLLYLLDNDIFKMNMGKSWDLFTPFLPSQDTREQTVVLDTWVIQVGNSFARSLGVKKPYCPIEVIIHSRLTVFRMLGAERMPWLGYSVLELSLTVLRIAAKS